MTREELLSKPEFWLGEIQQGFYRLYKQIFICCYKQERLEQLGIVAEMDDSIRSGEFNGTLSEFVEISLKMGFVPKVTFEPINEVIEGDRNDKS